jgi:hypothetical protein
VQILNSAVYKAVTGEAPPTRPVDAKVNKRYGYPFFKMYKEPNRIYGNFSTVKSIAQMDQEMDTYVELSTVIIGVLPCRPR